MRIVVKVGTSTLAHPGGLLNIRHTEDLVRVWSDIQNAGHQLIVVSSAATGLGAGKLQIEKPGDLVTKQAAAAVGQCELMYTYDRLFGLGCEMGISTQKLHARGPMGLAELCTYKYIVHGNGQVRGGSSAKMSCYTNK